MPKEIFMPKLSSTMEIGTLLQWFKEEGDSVEIGEPLFEIMTDKINIEVEAYDDGIFLKNTTKLMIKFQSMLLLDISERQMNRCQASRQHRQMRIPQKAANHLHQPRLHPVLLKPQKHLMKKYVPRPQREKRQRIIMW